MNSVDFGALGEAAAQDFLQSNGFRIRHCNWRWGHKELDIVAEKNRTLHVVEVKTRSANFLVSPQATVDRRKQQHTVQAANAYAQQFSLELDVQFDIISVVVRGEKCEVEYIPEAFYPTAKNVW
ncbi:MAG: YraN family protein [Prevotellaceae bacterium]|jgi:putative endonuclease|nr:YraN family protein [Prevotellaceae bacterium]